MKRLVPLFATLLLASCGIKYVAPSPPPPTLPPLPSVAPSGQLFRGEAAGGASLAQSLKLVGPRGTVVAYGNSAREPTTFLVNDFYLKQPRLVGYFLVGDAAARPVGEDLARLLELVATGRLDPQLALEASWREAESALEALRERRVAGKVVLHLD